MSRLTASHLGGNSSLSFVNDGQYRYEVRFPLIEARQVRVTFANPAGAACGLTELELWGPGRYPYQPAPPPLGNLAFNPQPEGFPKATASFSDPFGGKPDKAIDRRLVFTPTPMSRWTSYGSPNPESDTCRAGRAVRVCEGAPADAVGETGGTHGADGGCDHESEVFPGWPPWSIRGGGELDLSFDTGG
jgi:hypothetical protein